MIKKFDEFNSKFKFLFGLKKDREVAESLNIRKETFVTRKITTNMAQIPSH